MKSIYCAVCKTYEDSLQSLKSISGAWITVSTNQKVNNVLEHATSKVHKVVMTRKRVDAVKGIGGSAVPSSMIGHCLSMLDNGTRTWMEKKFDLCFVMAKQSVSFAKYISCIARAQVALRGRYRQCLQYC